MNSAVSVRIFELAIRSLDFLFSLRVSSRTVIRSINPPGERPLEAYQPLSANLTVWVVELLVDGLLGIHNIVSISDSVPEVREKDTVSE